MKYDIENSFKINWSKRSNQNTVVGENFRISVISSRIIRMEYDENNNFTDDATQVILQRNLGDVVYEVTETDSSLTIITDHLIVEYNKQKFSKSGLSIRQRTAPDQHSIWRYSVADARNLRSTIRTLDDIDGAVELQPGLNSRNGYGIIDDSDSLILNQDGSVAERKPTIDIYYFGFGLEYEQCIDSFYQMTGKPPVIPKFMLGNWWSRYWEYNENSLKATINKFKECEIPLAVNIMDMDWHVVDVPADCGSGWTGFTWNKNLFPNPAEILKWQHDQGLKVALNLHPADGFRYFEEDYEAIANDLNIDANSKIPIAFDVTSKKFMNSYFKNFIEKNEKIGIDFWWMDWQQGSTSALRNLDPLWMVNHQHFLHAKSTKEQPAIFSRFAGPGSHRYPIGFSGDTHMTWNSLAFQTYFTATSANIGYNCWSHDIGGHMFGQADDELYVRWTQFGVFTPIFRFHSGKTLFIIKEPWQYPIPVFNIVKSFMQLRHQLIPYIYTMNFLTTQNSKQLIRPLYFEYPEQNTVYDFQNQYLFGTEMMIAPVVTKLDDTIKRAMTKICIPSGVWYDQTGFKYVGPQVISYFTTLEQFPIFYKAGAIVPTAVDFQQSHIENCQHLAINLYKGNGEFTLYEEDNLNNYLQVKMTVNNDNAKVEIIGSDEYFVKNNNRKYTLNLIGFGNVKFNQLNLENNNLEIQNIYENCSLKFSFDNQNELQKIIKDELIKAVIDCKLPTSIKQEIENNPYLLNEQATLNQKVQAVNGLSINDMQRQLLLSIVSKEM